MKKNQHATSYTYKKISAQQVPWRKSASRGEKSMCKFLNEKSQHATSYTNQKNMQQVPLTKSARNKFLEQNQFHEEKNQCTSFAKRKKNQHATSFTNKKKQSAHKKYPRSKKYACSMFHEQN